MIFAMLLVLAAALSLILILGVSLSRSLRASGGAGLHDAIQPVDIAAFRNLIDPVQDEYLRQRLPPAEFRLVRRQRLRAMAAYVQVAARNAAVLARMGQAALPSADPQTAEAARQLVDQSAMLRRNAAIALARIYIALAWPNSGLAATTVLHSYERLNGSAMLFGRLRNPAAPVRISATL